MKLNTTDRIRAHIAAYPVKEYYTVDRVKRELGLNNMAGKSYVFAALVEKGFSKEVEMKKEKGKRYWLYQKIMDFTLEDAKPSRKSTDAPLIPHEELDLFIFGGNPERVAVELYRRREFV